MKILLLPCLLLSSALLGLAQAEVHADDAHSLAAPNANASTHPQLPHGPLVTDLDFPGGPLSQLVAVLRSQAGGDGFNLLAESADLQVEVPPLTLRNADMDGIVSAIDILLTPKGLRMRPVGRNIFTVLRQPQDRFFPNRVFMSFRLAQVLDAYSVDDITDAIRSGWELDPAHNPKDLLLKYHPATKLLLVSGSPDAIEIAKTIYSSIGGTRSKKDGAPENFSAK